MENNAPLNDINVLDASGAIGHYAGKLLADLGANVIKIEPIQGDSTRNFAPYLPNGESLLNKQIKIVTRKFTTSIDTQTLLSNGVKKKNILSVPESPFTTATIAASIKG